MADEKVERLGRDGVFDEAFERLRIALRNLDESKVEAAVFSILGSGLVPLAEERGPASSWALPLYTHPLTHALICQRTDGCRGSSHPYVVKFCVIEYDARHRFCDDPDGIDEAIYQTSTPLEYATYSRLYSWMARRLLN